MSANGLLGKRKIEKKALKARLALADHRREDSRYRGRGANLRLTRLKSSLRDIRVRGNKTRTKGKSSTGRREKGLGVRLVSSTNRCFRGGGGGKREVLLERGR